MIHLESISNAELFSKGQNRKVRAEVEMRTQEIDTRTYGAKVWAALNSRWPARAIKQRGTAGIHIRCRHCQAQLSIDKVVNWNDQDATAWLSCPNKSIFSRKHDVAICKSRDGGATWMRA